MSASAPANCNESKEEKTEEESECQPAPDAAATMDPNPAVMLLLSLLAATAVTDDRIVFTKRTSAYDDLVAVFGPVGCNLVLRDGFTANGQSPRHKVRFDSFRFSRLAGITTTSLLNE